MRNHLMASFTIALTACERIPEPEGKTVRENEKTISREGATHLLHQNDVRITLGGTAWKFDPKDISNLEVVKVKEQAGQSYPFTAVVRFEVLHAGRRYEVAGWLRYARSEAFKGMLKRADDGWWRVVKVRDL